MLKLLQDLIKKARAHSEKTVTLTLEEAERIELQLRERAATSGTAELRTTRQP